MGWRARLDIENDDSPSRRRVWGVLVGIGVTVWVITVAVVAVWLARLLPE